jgi:hypothetical protein
MTLSSSDMFPSIFVNEHNSFEEMSASVIRVEVFAIKINKTDKSETLVPIYQTTCRHNDLNTDTVITPYLNLRLLYLFRLTENSSTFGGNTNTRSCFFPMPPHVHIDFVGPLLVVAEV